MTGPDGFFESRTRVAPTGNATSTQSVPSVLPLKLLLRQVNRDKVHPSWLTARHAAETC
jgi:hypothetical protein